MTKTIKGVCIEDTNATLQREIETFIFDNQLKGNKCIKMHTRYVSIRDNINIAKQFQDSQINI
ncbi:MAG: hypothetical protein [Wendovervirus sonii]|uniref:Uncharacterized protein n=1 Tax=phage Lak_Megaphage_Sonny TaxID=3109229 RepID=A0ABZ0Z4X5_9CAUD|nr:MAG: hypothetical protein [phage Lak_Megaphage_Sonny]